MTGLIFKQADGGPSTFNAMREAKHSEVWNHESPLPLRAFVTCAKPEGLRVAWEVLDAQGKSRGYVREPQGAYAQLKLALEIAGRVATHEERGFLSEPSFNHEAALAGVLISFDHESLETERSDHWRLRHSFTGRTLLAWVPAGFTLLGTQVLWHPEDEPTPTADW